MPERCYGCMRIKQESPVCAYCGYDSRTDNEIHQLPVGTLVGGQYVLGKVLGQGGFGITYLGWDRILKTAVAVKEYYPSGNAGRDTSCTMQVSGYRMDAYQNGKKRFLREAEALAKLLDTSQIVRVLAYFEENDTAYIVMEYVEGMNLRSYVASQNGILTAEETFRCLKPIMEALMQVHKQKLVHRDISPDNIMIKPDGSAVLLDFGAVRLVQNPDAEGVLTSSTHAILKHGYAPPEQYKRRGALGPWTDIYALCATVYYCLTGTVPEDSMTRMMEGKSVNWQAVTGLSEWQKEVLERGMEPDPTKRIGSVEELYRDLFMENGNRKGQNSRHNTGMVKILSALVCFAILGCSAAIWYFYPMRENRDLREQPVTTTAGTESTEETVLPMETTVPEGTIAQDILHPAIAAGNILMETPTDMAAENIENQAAFRTDALRYQIQTITILDTLADAPETAVDVSQGKNGKILAWIETSGSLVDLYIAGEGGVCAPANSYALFYGMTNLKEIRGQLITDNVVDMSNLFHDCISLELVDLSSWETGKATNMSGLFYNCRSLTQLDVSGFDTGKVTDMSHMFHGCKGLKELDLRNFATDNLTVMYGMFMDCSGLINLRMEQFRIDEVDNLSVVFSGCASLEELDLSGFDTAGVTWFSYMFHNCDNLKNVIIGNFDTTDVPNPFNYNNFMHRGGTVNGQLWESWFQ